MIKIAQWGFGAMGSGIARRVHEQGDLELVGIISNIPEHTGKDMGDILDLGHRTGVAVSSEPEEVLSRKPEMTILATGSFLAEVFPLIKKILEAGSNCITIAEEAAYPWRSHPELARELDEIAKANGVSVLGTGVNPGFILDTLILTLTGACRRVDKIAAQRINDLSAFGPTVMKTQGVGTTQAEFEAGLASGKIVGHIGFQQSIAMLAAGLGWELDEIVEKREPIISTTFRKTQYAAVEPGQVAGCRHSAVGIRDGRVVIELEHPQQIQPHLEGVQTGDFIRIEGEPPLSLSIQPEVPGGEATINLAVNMIAPVLAAKPGMLTMLDLPLPRCRSM